MLDMYARSEALKLERQLRSEQQAREVIWRERMTHTSTGVAFSGLRCRLARALLALADRLDPCTAVQVPCASASSALNGTLRRA